MDQAEPAGRKPLPQREREICARLKEMRLALRFSQKEVAEQIGISRVRLASYEDARVPIRFEIALRFCRHLIVGEEWLAIGDTKLQERVTPPGSSVPKRITAHNYKRMCACLEAEDIARQIKPGTLFSAAFDEYFAKPYIKLIFSYQLPSLILFEGDTPQIARNFLECVIDEQLELLDAQKAHRFIFSLAMEAKKAGSDLEWGGPTESEMRRLIEEGTESGELHRKDEPVARLSKNKRLNAFLERAFPKYLERFANVQLRHVPQWTRKDVDAVVISGKVEAMKAQWPGVLDRLKKATKTRGAASALARELGVPLASVSRWLGGKREPSGEIALKLLHWVEQQKIN